MHILIDKACIETFLYVIGKSYIAWTWNYIIVLNIKGKQNFKHIYYIHILEMNKRESVQSYLYNENSE